MTIPEIPFAGFPKMARLSRDIVISEKLDGTSAQIFIDDAGQMFFGSRNRWITPEDDNYGFAAWGERNREELLKLGPGRHFGEWWGIGIQRNYGQPIKRFSLFNTARWVNPDVVRTDDTQEIAPNCCRVVPVLYRGPFDTARISGILVHLEKTGSVAAPGFSNPEGIVIFHIAAGVMFKKTIEKDEHPKTLQGTSDLNSPGEFPS